MIWTLWLLQLGFSQPLMAEEGEISHQMKCLNPSGLCPPVVAVGSVSEVALWLWRGTEKSARQMHLVTIQAKTPSLAIFKQTLVPNLSENKAIGLSSEMWSVHWNWQRQYEILCFSLVAYWYLIKHLIGNQTVDSGWTGEVTHGVKLRLLFFLCSCCQQAASGH